MIKSQLVIIDSKDRVNPTSSTSSSFQYNLMYYGPTNIDSIRINKITIPFSWNPILAQTFVITIGGTPATITVPAGQWTEQQLASLIQAQITADFPSSGATLIFTPGQNVFTFTSPSAAYELNFTNTQNLYQNIGYMMGFFGLQSSPIIISGTAGATSSVIYPNLSGGPNIYVKSQKLQLYNTSFFNLIPDNVIQSIPVNAPVGNYIIWQNSVETRFEMNNSQFQANYDFMLVDEYDNYVNLQGLDWTIEIQFFYKF
jgi:hypothetical protein